MRIHNKVLAGVASVGFAAAMIGVAAPAASAAPLKPTFKANPAAVVETDSGQVSFVVQARNLPASTFYTLHSPGMNSACFGTPFFFPRLADHNGLINQSVHAVNCDPGRYRITLNEVFAPHTEYVTYVTVLSPRVVPGVGFKVAPKAVTESDDGNVSFALNGTSLPASTNWRISSPGLVTACNHFLAYNPTTFAFDLPFFFGAPYLQADFDGNSNLTIAAITCDPGTYLIEADQAEAPHQEYVASITILPPGTEGS
jgi:hypothetical protein